MKAESFFSEAEKRQIAETIAAVEKKTSGELVAMVVDQSDTYPEAGLLAGLTMGGLAALLLSDLFLADSLAWFLPLFLAGAGIFAGLAGISPPFLRAFISANRMEAMVSQRALRAFYEKGLHETRDKTGVLFLVSLLEHKVWILADAGIYAKISPETLLAYAAGIAKGIKEGRASEALCRQIETVGETLARHFPVKADDTNELPNEVLIG